MLKYSSESSVQIICVEDYFNCTTSKLQCIPWLWVCDGDTDCADGSDEVTKLCGWLANLSFPINFLLHINLTGNCFPDDWRCRDGSFKCAKGYPTCINSNLICDQHKHCSDGSEEESCGGLKISMI